MDIISCEVFDFYKTDPQSIQKWERILSEPGPISLHHIYLYFIELLFQELLKDFEEENYDFIIFIECKKVIKGRGKDNCINLLEIFDIIGEAGRGKIFVLDKFYFEDINKSLHSGKGGKLGFKDFNFNRRINFRTYAIDSDSIQKIRDLEKNYIGNKYKNRIMAYCKYFSKDFSKDFDNGYDAIIIIETGEIIKMRGKPLNNNEILDQLHEICRFTDGYICLFDKNTLEEVF